MSNTTQNIFRCLGFDHHAPKHIPPVSTPAQSMIFAYLRVIFGIIWLYNTWNASSGANKESVAHFIGLPMSAWQVHLAGNGIVLIDLYIALTLLLGRGLRSTLWICIVYMFGMWVGVEHLGDFNPATGGTDAGIAPPYVIAMILVYTTWRISQPITSSNAHTKHDHILLWLHAARYFFGFLWAWDALFKWHPYFVNHFIGYLVDAQQDQPAWLVSYLQVWIDLIRGIDPTLFGVLAALTEASIAWSLLSGRLMRYFLPVGAAFSLMVWSTAERFGGPYGNGVTGMPGNMFGNAIIYFFIFVLLMVLYRWPRRAGLMEASITSSESDAAR